MLNGTDPIIIFQFAKLAPKTKESISKIPIVSQYFSAFEMPPIPIYLSERLMGLVIESEEKSIDIETANETMTNGDTPQTNQKLMNSSISINMKAEGESVGLILLTAMCDLVVPKVTSKEYSISYFHRATYLFGGLLHSFNVSQNTDSDLHIIRLELVKSAEKAKKVDALPEVPGLAAPVTLQ